MENKNNVETTEDMKKGSVRRWKIDTDRCTLCGECVYACKRELLEIKDKMVLMEDPGGCNQCGDCAAACGYHAIVFS